MKKHPEQICIIGKNMEIIGSKGSGMTYAKCFEYVKRVEREV
jgi:hypothetical protein